MSLFSMFFFISLYLQDVLHFSAIKTGLSYLPLAVGIIISAGVGSQLVTRIGFKPVADRRAAADRGRLHVVLAGTRAPAARSSPTCSGRRCWPPSASGSRSCSVTIAAVTGTRPHEAGLASGLINTSQQVGGALGLAILATVANSRTQSLLESAACTPSVALTKGFDRAFLVGAGFAIVGAILAAVLISSRDSREQAEAARRGELDAVPA